MQSIESASMAAESWLLDKADAWESRADEEEEDDGDGN